MQETVIAAAMAAYDGASNPNRTRGGLKKCDEMCEIIFPRLNFCREVWLTSAH